MMDRSKIICLRCSNCLESVDIHEEVDFWCLLMMRYVHIIVKCNKFQIRD